MTDAFWDKRSQKYDDAIRKHDAVYTKTIERTRSLLTDTDVVLDFACASGEITLDIAPAVQHVYGIDVSGKMIDLARRKARDRQVGNVDFDQTDVFDEGLAGGSFSAVIAFDIFHLLDDVPPVLARLNDLLSAGGLLISQTPCLRERSWFFRVLIRLAQHTGLAPPILSLTVTELEALVTGCNFEILESTMWDKKNRVQWIVARKL